MSNLTAEERTERARTAANIRWSNTFNWEESPLDDAIIQLADLRAELARAQEIVNRRVDISNMKQPTFCYNPDCRKPIDLATGKWAGRRDRRNPETDEIESAYACSTRCWSYLVANFTPNPQPTSNQRAPHVERVEHVERNVVGVGVDETVRPVVETQPALVQSAEPTVPTITTVAPTAPTVPTAPVTLPNSVVIVQPKRR